MDRLQKTKDGWRIQKVSFSTFKKQTVKQEGLVLLGTGGDLNQWIDGVYRSLQGEGIAPEDEGPESSFSKAYLLTTTGGRQDLVLMFAKDTPLNIGKMAIWRLRVGDNSWVSDYKVNYAKHHRLDPV